VDPSGYFRDQSRGNLAGLSRGLRHRSLASKDRRVLEETKGKRHADPRRAFERAESGGWWAGSIRVLPKLEPVVTEGPYGASCHASRAAAVLTQQVRTAMPPARASRLYRRSGGGGAYFIRSIISAIFRDRLSGRQAVSADDRAVVPYSADDTVRGTERALREPRLLSVDEPASDQATGRSRRLRTTRITRR
jgi:hypothetical protein